MRLKFWNSPERRLRKLERDTIKTVATLATRVDAARRAGDPDAESLYVECLAGARKLLAAARRERDTGQQGKA
jgi:N-acetylglucosamine kinase-like BadF-type ATPase